MWVISWCVVREDFHNRLESQIAPTEPFETCKQQLTGENKQHSSETLFDYFLRYTCTVLLPHGITIHDADSRGSNFGNYVVQIRTNLNCQNSTAFFACMSIRWQSWHPKGLESKWIKWKPPYDSCICTKGTGTSITKLQCTFLRPMLQVWSCTHDWLFDWSFDRSIICLIDCFVISPLEGWADRPAYLLSWADRPAYLLSC